MEKGSIMLVATCIVSFAYLASGIPGTASFGNDLRYVKNLPRICDNILPKGVMVAAAGKKLGFDKSLCGRLYSVRCTGATTGKNACTNKNVTVMVVYASSYPFTLDLPTETVDIIANHKISSIIDIDYELI